MSNQDNQTNMQVELPEIPSGPLTLDPEFPANPEEKGDSSHVATTSAEGEHDTTEAPQAEDTAKEEAGTDNLEPSQQTPSADAEEKMHIDDETEQPATQPIAHPVQQARINDPPASNDQLSPVDPKPAEGWGINSIKNFVFRRAGDAAPVQVHPQQAQPQYDYKQLYEHYRRKYDLKKQEISHCLSELQRESEKSLKLQRQNEHLRQECEALKKCAEELRSHNEQFRTQILAMASGRGPMRDEESYIQSFEELKGLTEHGIVRLSRAQADHNLSNEEQNQILKLVSDLGLNGQYSADYFCSSESLFSMAYNNGRWRLPLIRHIIALYLFNQIFEPFSFGISPELSKGLKQIEKDIISRERQFANVLMVHQSVGRGALRLIEGKVNQLRNNTIVGLVDLLSLLLPKSPGEAIEQIATKVVEKAIDLKTAMTEEQALFKFYWIDCGKEFKEDRVEVTEDETSGHIFVCTFPGLYRINDKSKFIVVKASAMLESALKIQYQG